MHRHIRPRTCLVLVFVLLTALGSTANLARPPCPNTPAPPEYADMDHVCCDLEARGFNADDVSGIRWLRLQMVTPEFYPLRCEGWQQDFFDTIGRKMCRSGCWGYQLRLGGVNYEPLHLAWVSLALQNRNCTNNFAIGGYWCR
jgi:hypothetical protein